MLKGYSAVGHPGRLVEQLCGLELDQTSLERRQGQPRDGFEQGRLAGAVFAHEKRDRGVEPDDAERADHRDGERKRRGVAGAALDPHGRQVGHPGRTGESECLA